MFLDNFFQRIYDTAPCHRIYLFTIYHTISFTMSLHHHMSIFQRISPMSSCSHQRWRFCSGPIGEQSSRTDGLLINITFLYFLSHYICIFRSQNFVFFLEVWPLYLLISVSHISIFWHEWFHSWLNSKILDPKCLIYTHLILWCLKDL